MDPSIRKEYQNRNRAIRRHQNAFAQLEDAKADVLAACAGLAAASRKRKIDPDDEKAVMEVVKQESRQAFDEEIRLAMVDPAASWIRHDIDGPFEDTFCGKGNECWFNVNPDKINEFKGYMESSYAKGCPEGRRCYVCFDLCDKAELAIWMHKMQFNRRTGIEWMLGEEAKEDPYVTYTPEMNGERILSPDEWRTLTPSINCMVCSAPAVRYAPGFLLRAVCASTDPDHTIMNKDITSLVTDFQRCIACLDTPATHIFVGLPKMRLCDYHYEGRADLKEQFISELTDRARGGK